MARVEPFRALRYVRSAGADLTDVTAPPYDVISPDYRDELLRRNGHNVVAIELPKGPADRATPGNRYETARARWGKWLDEGVLAMDAAPAVYLLEQRYRAGDAEIARRALIAAVGLEPFSAGVVLPHERTLPRALDDRLNMVRAVSANLSQVFGLYDDPAHAAAPIVERAMSGPPLETATGDDGVVSRIWAITDPDDHSALAAQFASQRIFIADGHHRYTTALAYRDERRATAGALGAGDVAPAYDSVMMALVNMADPGLVVHPTHRIADAAGEFDPSTFWAALAPHFLVDELPAGHAADALASAADRPSFIVRTCDGITRLVRLREDADLAAAFPARCSSIWRGLDVAVLQELILSPLLDIHPERPETLDRLSFSKDAHAALKAAKEHDVVFILNPTKMSQVAEVALAGETMPQKSTYFYPKLLSGLLFKSLDTL